MKSFRRIAKVLSESPLFSKARLKWEENQRDWHLALTKLDKLGIGVFLILRDYAAETFGATSDNEQQAYKAEIDYKKDLPGLTEEEARLSDLRKPFWDADSLDYYLQHLITLVRALEKLDILPPSRLLELGCGSGWTAEFLATRGYHVVGTSIADIDIADARLRKKSLVAKGLPDTLEFFVSPMENIDEAVDKKASFDCVYIFEALHHVYDWKKSLSASYQCLRKGGWLLLCNEPNLIHTFVAYRGGVLSNTHEVGMSRSHLVNHLRQIGFSKVIVGKNRWAFGIRPHWIFAQR